MDCTSQPITEREETATNSRLYRAKGHTQLFRNLHLREAAEKCEIDRFALRLADLRQGRAHSFTLVVLGKSVVRAIGSGNNSGLCFARDR